VIGRGPTLPEAFAQVALGVFALVADPASVVERDTREVRAHGAGPEALLVNWLNECLYVLDLEGFVARRVEFAVLSLDPGAPGGEPLRLHCRLHGEELDPARHAPRAIVGRVHGEGASVVAGVNGLEARAIVAGDGTAGS